MYCQLQLRGDMRQVTKIRSALLNCMTAKSCMSVVEIQRWIYFSATFEYAFYKRMVLHGEYWLLFEIGSLVADRIQQVAK